MSSLKIGHAQHNWRIETELFKTADTQTGRKQIYHTKLTLYTKGGVLFQKLQKFDESDMFGLLVQVRTTHVWVDAPGDQATGTVNRKAGSGCPMGGWSVTQHYANGGFPVFHGLDLMVGKMVTKDTSQCITAQYITNVRKPMTNPCSHPDQSCICKWQCFGGPVCGDVWEASTSRRWLGAKGSQEPQLQQPQWKSCRKKQTVGPKES